jgi:hypothetical protein
METKIPAIINEPDGLAWNPQAGTTTALLILSQYKHSMPGNCAATALKVPMLNQHSSKANRKWQMCAFKIAAT